MWVGPRMKFPSASDGGMAASGNSLAATYPGEWGSRVGGVGRGRCADGGGVWAMAKPAPAKRVIRHAMQ